jgi:hypothetical protein
VGWPTRQVFRGSPIAPGKHLASGCDLCKTILHEHTPDAQQNCDPGEDELRWRASRHRRKLQARPSQHERERRDANQSENPCSAALIQELGSEYR